MRGVCNITIWNTECSVVQNNNNNNNNKFTETVHHIISACPILAKEQYIKRHDGVCVHNYTLTYARKQGYNWTKNTDMNMFQNQYKQVKEAR